MPESKGTVGESNSQRREFRGFGGQPRGPTMTDHDHDDPDLPDDPDLDDVLPDPMGRRPRRHDPRGAREAL